MARKFFALLAAAGFIIILSACMPPVSGLYVVEEDEETFFDVINVGSTAPSSGSGWIYDDSAQIYYVEKPGKYLVVGDNNIPCPQYTTPEGDTVLASSADARRIVVLNGITATLHLHDVQIETPNGPALDIDGATVTVLLSGNSKLVSIDVADAGIHVTTGTALTITSAAGDGSENGSLTVWGGQYAAGIGGSQTEDGGTITINGGTIEAVGSADASYPTLWSPSGNPGEGAGAGIGGGGGDYTSGEPAGDGGTITINGGDVTAKVGCDYYGSAGIGGGAYTDSSMGKGGEAGDITITGGTIIADLSAGGDTKGAGIGSGYDPANGNKNGKITITGGTVTAKSKDGAAIGGGYYGGSGTIGISGGDITAEATTSFNHSGAGIGGAENGNALVTDYSGSITISGGNIKASSKSDTYLGTGTAAAAIGSDYSNSTGRIQVTIKGGTIYAYVFYASSTNHSAAIGGGYNCDADVVIEGGTIVAVNSFYSLGNASEMAIGSGVSGTVAISGGTIITYGCIGGSAVPVTSLTNAVVIVRGSIADTSGSPLSGAAVNGSDGVLASTTDVTVSTSGTALPNNPATDGTVTLGAHTNFSVPDAATLTVPAGWTICGIPAGTYPGASLVFFKEVTANTPTTTLTLYFDKIIPGLDANNIALTVPSGKTMVKGGFSRTSTTPGMVEYTLGVTCSGGGSGYVEVTVSRPGYIIYTHNGSPLADTAWF